MHEIRFIDWLGQQGHCGPHRVLLFVLDATRSLPNDAEECLASVRERYHQSTFVRKILRERQGALHGSYRHFIAGPSEIEVVDPGPAMAVRATERLAAMEVRQYRETIRRIREAVQAWDEETRVEDDDWRLPLGFEPVWDPSILILDDRRRRRTSP